LCILQKEQEKPGDLDKAIGDGWVSLEEP